MSRRGYYLVTSLYVAIGFCLIAWFVPRGEQWAVMLLQGYRTPEALQYLQETTGVDLSATELVTMAQAFAELAQDEKAVQLFLSYLHDHPRDMQMRRVFDQQLQDSHYFDLLLENLWEIAREEPSREVLRRILALSEELGESESYKQALVQLYDTGLATPSELLRLAFVYRFDGARKEALALVNQALALQPIERFETDNVLFTVELLLEFKQAARAIKLSRRYLQKPQTAPFVSGLLEVLVAAKQGQAAIKLLDMTAATYLPALERLKIALSILSQAGKVDEAQNRLYFALQKQTVPASLLQDYLPLLLTTLTPERLQLILSTVSSQKLSPQQVFSLFRIVAEKPELYDLKRVQRWMQDSKSATPTLQAAVEALQELRTPSLEQPLSPRTKLWVALALYAQGEIEDAQGYIEGLQPPSGLTVEEAEGWGQLLVSSQRPEEGLALAKHMPDGPPTLALRHISEAALGLLDPHEFFKLSNREALLLANISLNFGHEEVVLALLEERPVTPETKAWKGVALAKLGRVEEARVFLRALNKERSTSQPYYLYVLAALALQEDSYLSALQQEIKRLSDLPEVLASRLRTIAYELKRIGVRKPLEPLLTRIVLAENSEENDVYALIDLWSEEPDTQQLKFIIEQAKVSPHSLVWLQYLADKGHHHEILSILRGKENLSLTIAELYFRALLETDADKSVVTAFVQCWLPLMQDEKKRLQWGIAAQDYGYYFSAIQLFCSVLEQQPEEQEALFRLGSVYFFQGNLKQAQRVLNRYLQLACDPEPMAFFYYAESLHYDYYETRARDYYKSALSVFGKKEKLTVEEEMSILLALQRLGRVQQAWAYAKHLLAKHAESFVLRLALAQLAIEYERFSAAEQLLFTCSDWRTIDEEQKAALTATRISFFSRRSWPAAACALSSWSLRRFPCKAEFLTAHANCEQERGRWRQALYQLRCAQSLEPRNLLLYRQRQQLWSEHTPFVSSSFFTEHTGQSERKRRYRLAVDTPLLPYLRLLVDYEHMRVLLRNFTPITGAPSTRFNGNRDRVRLGLLYPGYEGITATASLLNSRTILGVKGKVQAADLYGYSMIHGAYREPDWDQSLALIQEGARDSIGLARLIKVAPRWTVLGDAQYKEYYLLVNEHVGTSYAVNVSIDHQLPKSSIFLRYLGEDSQIGLSYRINQERVIRQQSRLNSDGVLFQPLGLSNFELHSGELNMARRLRCWLAWDVRIGYLFDRVSKSRGAVGDGRIIFGRVGGVQGIVSYSHSISTDLTGQQTDRIEFSIKAPI